MYVNDNDVLYSFYKKYKSRVVLQFEKTSKYTITFFLFFVYLTFIDIATSPWKTTNNTISFIAISSLSLSVI